MISEFVFVARGAEEGKVYRRLHIILISNMPQFISVKVFLKQEAGRNGKWLSDCRVALVSKGK